MFKPFVTLRTDSDSMWKTQSHGEFVESVGWQSGSLILPLLQEHIIWRRCILWKQSLQDLPLKVLGTQREQSPPISWLLFSCSIPLVKLGNQSMPPNQTKRMRNRKRVHTWILSYEGERKGCWWFSLDTPSLSDRPCDWRTLGAASGFKWHSWWFRLACFPEESQVVHVPFYNL